MKRADNSGNTRILDDIDRNRILDEYHRLIGLAVLVDTSVNMHEEPIVCTPHDAINAFLANHLDVLIAGPFLAVNDRKLSQ